MPETNGSRKRSRLRIALYTAGVLIAAFVIPPFISLDLIHLDRFRARLIVSIGRSLGRRVSTGSVRLRLLPRPGFDISNFVVDDDPRYGPEPVLRAAEVRAHLRLASLWGGHLQIASLSLENASLNLVRGKDGTWNLGQLLLQAAQTPSAPTAKLKIEARPRFPYIEVSDGRINFKSGDEKKVFALKEAEFALWLASEDRWNMRLKARPMRSDQNLADTGTISVSGSFDRARSIDQIPFHLKVSIDGAQLGQLTRLIYGYDRGWHAGVHLLTEVRGTPTDFSSSTEATFSSFRRYDIATASNLDMRVRCAGRHRRPGNAPGVFPQTEMECLLPLGDGRLRVAGSFAEPDKGLGLELNVTAEQVPVSAIAFVLLHAKSTLPQDFSGSGLVNGSIAFARDLPGLPAATWKGTMSVQNAVLRSRYLDPELALGNFNVSFGQQDAFGGGTKTAAPLRPLAAKRPPPLQPAEQSIATIVPFDIALGPTPDCKVSGSFSASRYQLRLDGLAQIPRLLQLARTLGINPPRTEMKGDASLDLQMYGPWQGFSPVQIAGSAELSQAVLPLRGISEPLSIAYAQLSFAPSRVQVQDLNASFPNAQLSFTGKLEAQRNCPERPACNFSFALETSDLESAALQRLLQPQESGFPFFSSSTTSPAEWLLAAGGKGTVSAAHLRIDDLVATNTSARLVLGPQKIVFMDLQADLLGGHHTGDWVLDLASAKPSYSGRGRLQHLNVQLLSTAMKETWGSGDLDLQYRLNMHGSKGAELFDTATGSAQFDWRNGKLFGNPASHDVIDFADWSGAAMLKDRAIRLEENRVRSNSGIQRVSGVVALDKSSELEFKKPKGPGFIWKGPLDAPEISGLPNNTSLLEVRP